MSSTIFFFLFIPLLAFILLAVNLIFAPHNPYFEKNSVFECGFSSFLGQNRTQFSISFFIFALLFLLFDLEILLVYPYLVSAYTNGVYGLVIMLMFLLALTLGFAFELGKKALFIDSRQISKMKVLTGYLDLLETKNLLCLNSPPKPHASVSQTVQSDHSFILIANAAGVFSSLSDDSFILIANAAVLSSLSGLYFMLIAHAAAVFSSLSEVAFHMYNGFIFIMPCLIATTFELIALFYDKKAQMVGFLNNVVSNWRNDWRNNSNRDNNNTIIVDIGSIKTKNHLGKPAYAIFDHLDPTGTNLKRLYSQQISRDTYLPEKGPMWYGLIVTFPRAPWVRGPDNNLHPHFTPTTYPMPSPGMTPANEVLDGTWVGKPSKAWVERIGFKVNSLGFPAIVSADGTSYFVLKWHYEQDDD